VNTLLRQMESKKKALSQQFCNIINDLNYKQCRYMQTSSVIHKKSSFYKHTLKNDGLF